MSDTPLDGIVALLDDTLLDDHIGVVEVLTQEGVTSLSLPTGAPDFEELASLYGQRVRLEVHGPVDDSAALVARGADFTLPDFLPPDAAIAAATLKVACYASAMTPNETLIVLEMSVTGVQLHPAEVVGPTMAEHLRELGLTGRVVPYGGLISFTAKQWLKADSPAVCIDQHLIGDAFTGGDLAALRDHCRSLAWKNTDRGLTTRIRQSPWDRRLRSRDVAAGYLRGTAADPVAASGHVCGPE